VALLSRRTGPPTKKLRGATEQTEAKDDPAPDEALLRESQEMVLKQIGAKTA
jgi:hypothetical protein